MLVESDAGDENSSEEVAHRVSGTIHDRSDCVAAEPMTNRMPNTDKAAAIAQRSSTPTASDSVVPPVSLVSRREDQGGHEDGTSPAGRQDHRLRAVRRCCGARTDGVLRRALLGERAAPDQAKDTVVTIVDDTAGAVGGTWSVASGPAVQGCMRDNGARGAAYLLTEMREQRAGDPADDVATVERLWKDKGLSTERHESGGTDPTQGVRGTGGPATSIDFLADERGYSLDAVSVCTAGNAEELQRNGE